MKYWLYYFMAALFYCGELNAQTHEPVQVITQAQFKATAATHFKPVTLPHTRKVDNNYHGQSLGVYQLSLGKISSDTTYSLLLPTLDMSANIRLNGIELFRPEQTSKSLSRHWNTPLRIHVPQSTLSLSNTLEIKLLSESGYGMLAPVFIGPKNAIEAIYQQRVFWQQTIHKYLFAVCLCAGAFSLLLWLHQRQRMAFFYFSAAVFFWSFYNFNLFIVNLPISAKLWAWWVHSCIDFWAVLMVLFSHRIINVHYPRFEQALISFAIGASAVYFVTDLNHFSQISNKLHLISVALIAYIGIRQLPECRKPDNAKPLLLVTSSVVMVILSGYDFYTANYLSLGPVSAAKPLGWLHQVTLSPIVQPLFSCLMLWLIIKRYAELANNTEDLQKNLEYKIHDTTQNYQREQLKLQSLHIAKAATQERAQVYQSLYEDLADKLSAIYHTAADSKQADAAQAAIAELRDTAQTHQYQTHQLDTELANIRAEISGRCEQVGIILSWETLIDIPPLAVNSSIAITLKRILREAVSNIIKHANATRVSISISIDVGPNLLLIRLADNGIGINDTATTGRGIANMHKRASDVGGSVSLSSHPAGGTLLQLSVPCKS